MQRIAVIGSPGSGKSTLAVQLGRLLGLPVYHLDALHWKPGWVETPKPEWRALQQSLVAASTWVIDGNYSTTLDIRLSASDTIIFFDMPRLLCLWRVVRRVALHRGRTRTDMGPGCPERVDLNFLLYIWRFPGKQAPRIRRLLASQAGKRVVVLRRPADTPAFLAAVRAARPSGAPASSLAGPAVRNP